MRDNALAWPQRSKKSTARTGTGLMGGCVGVTRGRRGPVRRATHKLAPDQQKTAEGYVGVPSGSPAPRLAPVPSAPRRTSIIAHNLPLPQKKPRCRATAAKIDAKPSVKNSSRRAGERRPVRAGGSTGPRRPGPRRRDASLNRAGSPRSGPRLINPKQTTGRTDGSHDGHLQVPILIS